MTRLFFRIERLPTDRRDQIVYDLNETDTAFNTKRGSVVFYPGQNEKATGGAPHNLENTMDQKKFRTMEGGNPPRQGEWAMPGGAVELGVTQLEQAYLEVEEELGISRDRLLWNREPLGCRDVIIKDEANTSCTITCPTNNIAFTINAVAYAGECTNGDLITLTLRTATDHCGTCDAGYGLGSRSCTQCVAGTYANFDFTTATTGCGTTAEL